MLGLIDTLLKEQFVFAFIFLSHSQDVQFESGVVDFAANGQSNHTQPCGICIEGRADGTPCALEGHMLLLTYARVKQVEVKRIQIFVLDGSFICVYIFNSSGEK